MKPEATGETFQEKLQRFGLAKLFDRAAMEGLWFFLGYQDIWFSPAELRRDLEAGRFWWGATNWQLLDPRVQLEHLTNKIEAAKKERDEFERRMLVQKGPAA
jgi:hypothetical protein